jgi:hypothetical protein
VELSEHLPGVAIGGILLEEGFRDLGGARAVSEAAKAERCRF